MKRYILFSLFLTIVCASINAQLPNTFFGATLGKTTKHQAIEMLLAQKARFTGNGEDYLSVKNVTFDGFQYKSMTMHFYDDILYFVYFEDGLEFDFSKFNQLKEQYTTRFSSFKYHFIEDGALFDDDVTKLAIYRTCVVFRDMKLEKQEKQDVKKLYREIHPYNSTRISQIVLGCTLGASTKQQVINAMKSSGCRKVPFNSLDGSDQLCFSGTSVAGVSFSNVVTTFIDGKLADVMFLRYQNPLSQYEVNTLRQHFGAMYSAYDKKEDIEKEHPDSYMYNDDRIIIAFAPDGLNYSDVALKEKESRTKERSLRGKVNN